MATDAKTRLTAADVKAGATTARAGKLAGNPYLPEVATVVEIIDETPTIKTFRLRFDDPEVQKSFSFLPGQVGQLGIFGVGESTFAITTKPSERDFIQFSVMKAGEVTKALHNLSEGDKVGIRAPMGCGFPVEDWKGKKILFVMGGIGSAALKATIEYTLEHRADYAGVSILYGATHPTNFTYQYDIDDWQKRKDIDLTLTIDKECEDWQCDVGLVPRGAGEDEPRPQGHHSHPLRPADNDQVHPDELREAGLHPRADLHHPREAHEVRHRDLRPLQRRAQVRVRGRACVLDGGVERAAGRAVGIEVDPDGLEERSQVHRGTRCSRCFARGVPHSQGGSAPSHQARNADCCAVGHSILWNHGGVRQSWRYLVSRHIVSSLRRYSSHRCSSCTGQSTSVSPRLPATSKDSSSEICKTDVRAPANIQSVPRYWRILHKWTFEGARKHQVIGSYFMTLVGVSWALPWLLGLPQPSVPALLGMAGLTLANVWNLVVLLRYGHYRRKWEAVWDRSHSDFALGRCIEDVDE